MERKEFIQTSCNVCLLVAAGYFFSTLAGCTTKFSVFKTDLVDTKVRMPLSMFKQSSFQLLRLKGWEYDIAVERKRDNLYTALLLKCTHQENQLVPAGNGFHCSLHGSQFDKDGNVQKGPAERPLENYRTYVEEDNLIIEILKLPKA
jgi:nitrite reductase/ring-hydroxylating ferredoxin subunit